MTCCQIHYYCCVIIITAPPFKNCVSVRFRFSTRKVCLGVVHSVETRYGDAGCVFAVSGVSGECWLGRAGEEMDNFQGDPNRAYEGDSWKGK